MDPFNQNLSTFLLGEIVVTLMSQFLYASKGMSDLVWFSTSINHCYVGALASFI